jgi:hypothetical protein
MEELFETWNEELELCIDEWRSKFKTGIIDESDQERTRLLDFWSGTPVDPLSLQDVLRYIKEDVEFGHGEDDVSASIAELLALMTADVELSATSRARLEKFAALAIQLGMAYERLLVQPDRELADYAAERIKKDKQSAKKRELISNIDAYELCEAVLHANPGQSDRWVSVKAQRQLEKEVGDGAPKSETIRRKWINEKNRRKRQEEMRHSQKPPF